MFLMLLFVLTLLLLLAASPSEAKTHSFFITKEQAYNGMLRSDIPPRSR